MKKWLLIVLCLPNLMCARTIMQKDSTISSVSVVLEEHFDDACTKDYSDVAFRFTENASSLTWQLYHAKINTLGGYGFSSNFAILRTRNNGAYLQSPRIANVSQVSFKAKKTSGNMQYMVISSSIDGIIWTPVESVSVSDGTTSINVTGGNISNAYISNSTPYTYTINFAAAKDLYIRFEAWSQGASSDLYIGVDDIQITSYPWIYSYHPIERYDYTRAITPSAIGTLCLPYQVNEEDIHGIVCYQIVSKNSAETELVLDTIKTLQAGYPCIFFAEDTTNILACDYDSAHIASVAMNKNGLYGTYDTIVDLPYSSPFNVLEGNYFVLNKVIMQCEQGCSLASNRAYIKLSEVLVDDMPSMTPNKRKMAIVSIDDTAILNCLEEKTEGTRKIRVGDNIYIWCNGMVYSLQGALVQ